MPIIDVQTRNQEQALVIVKERRRKSQFKDALSGCLMITTGVSSHWVPSEESGQCISELATQGTTERNTYPPAHIPYQSKCFSPFHACTSTRIVEWVSILQRVWISLGNNFSETKVLKKLGQKNSSEPQLYHLLQSK